MAPSTRRKKDDRPLGIIEGKLPPQEVEIEKSIIGVILVNHNAFDKIADLLKPEVFYKQENQLIYEAMKELWEKKIKVDIISVTHKLKTKEKLDLVGGPAAVAETANHYSSQTEANIVYYSQIIYEKYIAREVIKSSYKFAEEAYQDGCDIFTLIDEARLFYSKVDAIEHQNRISTSVKHYAKQFINQLENTTETIIGKQTGLTLLDYRTGGFQDSDLIVIAARPGAGKTVLGLHTVVMSLKKNEKFGVYSYEMTGVQLVQRITSMMLSIKNNQIRANAVSQEQKDQMKNFASLINDCVLINEGNHDLNNLLIIMERDVMENGVKGILIDYLQLIPAPKSMSTKSRNDYIGLVSFSLKTFAKKHNVPVIVLAQLSRESEKRQEENKFTVYKMSDLRESGSIEQDADLIIFIDNLKDKARFQIGKFRHGEVGNVSIKFNKDYVRFEDNDEDAITRKAIAHFETFGRISTNFEDEMKTKFPEEESREVKPVPYGVRNPSEKEDDSTPAPF